MKHHSKSMQAKHNAAAEENLYEAFSLIKTAEEARRFIQDLCTPAEIQALADRWRVVADIKNRKSYRQINVETEVSVTTIGRVARCLMLGEGGYQLIYDRMKKIRTIDNSTRLAKKR
jgi:TrpR-related protein YerC/YecD